MLRIYKKNSDEIGNYTPTNNIMNFEDDIQSTDLYDYGNSYLQLNVNITAGIAGNFGAPNAAGPIKLYCLGDNTPDYYPPVGGNPVLGGMKFTPYTPSCLVMDDKLQSTNYNIGVRGLLESNRKLNFMQQNLNTFLLGAETRQSQDYYTGSMSLDLSLGASNATFPFTTLVKDGAVVSSNKPSNVIVPLKEVLPSFGNKVLPAWVGDLKHTYTLENRKHIIGEINPLAIRNGMYNKVDFLRFNDKTVAADPDTNQITLTLPFSTLAQLQSHTSSNIAVGRILLLTYTLTAGAINKARTVNIAAIAFANNACTITFNAGDTEFVAGDVIFNGKLHLNVMNFADLGIAGNAITTEAVVGSFNDFTNLVNFPLYVGMGVHLYNRVTAGPAYQNSYRKITNITGAGAARTITLDGAAIAVSTNINISFDGCYDGQNNDANTVQGKYATYSIDRAELVSWHLQGIKNQPTAPIIYNKYDLLPMNRQITSQFQNTYTLPDSGTVKTIMLMNEISSDSNLIAKDPNVKDYRLSFDNNPTTDRNIGANSPMYFDRIYKSLGGDVENLLVDPNSNIIMENNNTSNLSPLLDVQINALDGQTLASNSILNLFVKSTAVLSP